MRTHKMMIRPRFAALALALAVLTGCETYTPAEAAKTNEVIWVNLTHDVNFSPGATRLSAGELARLDDFLLQVDAQATDTLVVDPGGSAELALARGEAVTAFLRRRVPTSQPQARRIGLEDDGRVRLIVGRHLVLAPECPNWSKPSHRDPLNLSASNLGCATSVNIGLMVADPGDLVRGRRTTPGVGAAGALAIQRYRAGEVLVPESQTTGENE